MARRKIKARRLLAVLLVAAVLGQGTWWRVEVAGRHVPATSITTLRHSAKERAGLTVTGLWRLDGHGETSGGYSAMLLLGTHVRLFSDRGWLLTFPLPDQGPVTPDQFSVRQLYPTGMPLLDLLDIESVTRSTETGQYWVGYENRHTIYRYRVDGEPEAYVEPAFTRGWPDNGGMEALVRLRSGGFVAFHERGDDLFVYPADPVTGAAPVQQRVAWPEHYDPTDALELPDGRLLVLLRRVAWRWPVFESRLALLDPADRREGASWPVRPLVQLEELLPRDNWEAMALVPGEDSGAVTLWLAADDNRSAFQRSYLAKLHFTPPPRQQP